MIFFKQHVNKNNQITNFLIPKCLKREQKWTYTVETILLAYLKNKSAAKKFEIKILSK